jgi:hypothetical protein
MLDEWYGDYALIEFLVSARMMRDVCTFRLP